VICLEGTAELNVKVGAWCGLCWRRKYHVLGSAKERTILQGGEGLTG